MKKTLAITVVLVSLFTVCGPALAQEVPIEPLTKPIHPKLINIAGTWNYTLSAQAVTGMCPPGPAASGTCVITKSKTGYTLVLKTGSRCEPKAVCRFTGSLAKNDLLLSNTATVDDEGGTATTAWVLTVFTNQHLSGKGSSRYLHPEGFECQWSYSINLYRKAKP
ncbi:MAG: hypothetical protein EHM45_01005 [Desulfobacteraceae bacterium]|nr:MAG: hypothetical protein EHM45_01005 [Desulfobacteraceae bacterium]